MWKVREWKRAKVQRLWARSQRRGTRHGQRVHYKRGDRCESEGNWTETRSGRSRKHMQHRKRHSQPRQQQIVKPSQRITRKQLKEQSHRKCKKRQKKNKNQGPHTRKEDNGEARKRENPWNPQRDQKNTSGKTKWRKDRKEFRRSWKKSKEQETYPVSNQLRDESLSQRSKQRRRNHQDETRNRQGFCKILLRFIWRRRRSHWRRREVERGRRRKRTWTKQFHKRVRNWRDSGRHWPNKKRESERRQWNTSRTAQKLQWWDERKKSGQSSMKLHCKKTSHQKAGEKSEYKWFTKKVTEKMQATTGQYVVCQYCTSCSLQYFMLDLPLGLHKIQPPDQAGFRPNHRCDDHLMVYRVLEQRCREWGVPLYISTIDFTKAFDRI